MFTLFRPEKRSERSDFETSRQWFFFWKICCCHHSMNKFFFTFFPRQANDFNPLISWLNNHEFYAHSETWKIVKSNTRVTQKYSVYLGQTGFFEPCVIAVLAFGLQMPSPRLLMHTYTWAHEKPFFRSNAQYTISRIILYAKELYFVCSTIFTLKFSSPTTSP